MKKNLTKIITAVIAFNLILGTSALAVGNNNISIEIVQNTDSIEKDTLYNYIKSERNDITSSTVKINFSDIKGDEWFINDIILPIAYKVLTGYEDGTLRPNNYITPAEVAKVISATFEGDLGNGSNKWYDTYFKNVGKAFTYTAYSKMGTNHDVYMSQYNMKRCEIAYVIAKYVSVGSELDDYITSAKQGNLGSLSKFGDCGNLATDDDGTYDNDMRIMDSGWIPSKYAAALTYLVDKGIFQGDDQGNMKPLEPVTRAEVFALINRMASSVTSYTSGKYAVSDESLEVTTTPDGTIQQPTERPSWWGEEAEPGRYDGGGQPIEVWLNRPNLTLNANDPYRDRAKAGDTFIAADGTTYVLEAGIGGVVGQGLPIALDLGRTNSFGNSIKNGFKSNTNEFGWMDNTANTSGHEYIVYQTGEGHWDTEWGLIGNETKPQYEGTDGEWSADGYWVYNGALNRWEFGPLA